MEQLKLIKKELGLERDDKEALTAKFAERIADVEMPEEARYSPLPCCTPLPCYIPLPCRHAQGGATPPYHANPPYHTASTLLTTLKESAGRRSVATSS